jgi:aminoglycoside phosphotransferase (APT) family kinase protein
MAFDLPHIAGQFDLAGDLVDVVPYGSGHINDTYAVTMNQAGTPVRYILQRINHNVFREPAVVMENVDRVTRHQRARLHAEGAADVSRRALTLVAPRAGGVWHGDADGNTWRAYLFIEHARTYDVIETPDQARAAARAFGAFQATLADLPAPRLRETIPGFHDTPARFCAFQAALADDTHNRAQVAGDAVAYALRGEAMAGRLVALLAAGDLPERITHNDTKLNNVMLDDATGTGICVIDLDTVMPGLALYDFGDMVRSATNAAREDEQDLSKVTLLRPMFEALAQGYLESAGAFLTDCEREHLAFSAELITFEIGLRFLTDYLQGDRYFKIHRPGQNLDRARVQFKLAQALHEQQDWMQAVVTTTQEKAR